MRQVGSKPYQIVAPKEAFGSDQFRDLVAKKPYCTNDLSYGLRILPREQALRYKYVQPNGPYDVRLQAYDVDRPDAFFAAGDAILPEPNITILNKANGHAHLAYVLDTPVLKFSSSRLGPLAFLAAIERGYVSRLEADRCYSGLIMKNPLHDQWNVLWGRSEPYSLGELDSSLFARDKKFHTDPSLQSGLGRNCWLFDQLRHLAYYSIRDYWGDARSHDQVEEFGQEIHEKAMQLNLQFEQPLPLPEVRSTARSVSKWVWRNFTPHTFSKLQSARASKTRRQTKLHMARLEELCSGSEKTIEAIKNREGTV